MNKEIFYTMLAIVGGIAIFTLIAFLVGGDDQDVSGQEIMMCFATKELADDFLKQFPQYASHGITIGCPEFNLRNQTVDNESGK